MGTKNTIVTIALLVIALVLGYAIYRKLPSGPTATPVSQPAVSEPGQGNQAPSSQPTKALPPGLTPQEQAVFSFPGENASSDQRAQHSELVRSLAKEGSEVQLNANCVASPFVLQVKKGDTLTFKNNDSVDHSVRHGAWELLVPAKSTKTARVDFVPGVGDAGYGCDGGAGGVLHIIQ